MPRFRFKLQAVLDHREMLEQQKQKAVAELEMSRVRLEGVIRGCQEGIVAERSDMRQRLTAGDVHGARRQSAAATRLKAAADRAVLELAGVHRRLERARAELIAATKARKAVELLKERRFEAWRYEQQRQELAANDELAVMAAGRKEDVA